MNTVRTMTLTEDMRRRALQRAYDESPRLFRLTAGHRRYIAQVTAERRAEARLLPRRAS